MELVAFCDINEERLREKGERHGVTRLFTDVREMVKMPDLDVVNVCTWNSAHAPCTIAALKAGKHVLCEKPMAMNAAEAEAMQEAARKSGKLLMIGFVRRFGNDCAVVQDFQKEGYFGELYYAKATYLRRNGCPGLFERENAHFVSCASGEEGACRAPAEDGIVLMKILDTTYESARTGHEVILA